MANILCGIIKKTAKNDRSEPEDRGQPRHAAGWKGSGKLEIVENP